MGVLDDKADLLEERLKAKAPLLEGLGSVVTLLHDTYGLRGEPIRFDGQESSCRLDRVCNNSD